MPSQPTIRTVVASFLICLLYAPPAFAQAGGGDVQVLNPQGCRSLDPDFPISLRGHANPTSPDYTWELPHDPFATSCGYLDRDADGVLDWAEAELAWVFRPFLVFDNDETYAGKYDDTWMNGVTVYYQIHPVEHSMDGVTSAGPDLRLLKLKLIIAFRRDLTHDGDTETFEMELSGIRGPGTGRFTRWRIHAILAGNCSDPSACALHYGWADERVLSMSKTGEFRYYNPSIFYNPDYIDYPLNTQVYLNEYGVTETGTPCRQVSGMTPGSSGICLPKLYIAKNKHRPYLFKEICEGCCHGIGRDNCDGGIQMAACYGLPGAAVQQDEWRSGFEMLPQYLLHQGIQAFSWRSPVYVDTLVRYLGNVGEKHFTIRQMDESVRQRTLACRKVLENGYFEWPVSPRVCFGDALHHYLARMEQEEDCETACFLDPSCAGTSVVGEDLPNPAFLHYSTPHWGILELNTCITVDPDLLGMGTLSRQHANTDPLAARNQYFGVAGLYSNYPREPGTQSRQEFLFDFWSSVFCGSKSCDAQFMSEVAAGLKGKISVMPDADAYLTCPAIFFQDTDQDGAPDEWDCEPRNPYLQWDLDQDGHCDLPIPQGDLPACQEVCATLYFSMTHWSEAYVDCIRLCQGPHDNCSPLVSRFGVPYYDQNEASQCRSLMQKFDGALLWRCQRWFVNPDQTDHNQNGIGDHCERRISNVRVDIRADSFGTNRGHFAWCPDPTATVSAVLSNDREMGPSSKEMLSVGLCVCPGQTEASCRDDSTEELVLHCPSDPVADRINGDDYSMKDFAWDSRTGDFRYFYRPVEAASQRDLGTLTAQSKLDLEVHQDIEVPHQRLLARWRDAIFQGARVFLTFRTDQFREFPGFQPDSMLKTFPTETVVPTHDRYSKLKFSSPQILEPEAVDNRTSECRIPTHETWNPEAPTVEYDLIQVPPGMFSYDPETNDVCVHFPRPVGQPVGYAEGSPLPVNPLWDPPRDLLDPLFGWIQDEEGSWRLFGVDPASFQVRSYVALPPGLDLREADLRFLRVDASLVGGAVGVWSTVAAALDRGTLYLRDPLQPGAWTQVPTGIPVNQTILAFHQATPETAWVISRRNLITAPTLLEVHLGSGAILRQQTLPDWTFVRVESLAAPRMGEAYFLIKRPAHLLPNLWKLDKDGLRADLALPALVPPDRGALAMDGRMGKLYLVARAAADRKASLWVHDLVTKAWTRLSAVVPVSMLREPRLALTGERLVFSDLKDGRWWEWTQGRWVDLGNPLNREVGR